MRCKPLIACLAVMSVASLSLAQDTQQMLSGFGHPLTLKPDGLGLNYKAIQLKSTVSGSNGIMDMIMSPMMMVLGAMGGMTSDKDAPPMALLTAMDISWTTGETTSLFGQSYLLVYKLDIDISRMATSTPPKDLSDLNLRLQFVRTDTIASFSPRPDITSVDFVKMLRTPLPKSAEGGKPGQ